MRYFVVAPASFARNALLSLLLPLVSNKNKTAPAPALSPLLLWLPLPLLSVTFDACRDRLEDFIVKHRDKIPTGVPIVVCCKGIENGSLLTPFEILEEELPGKVGSLPNHRCT